MTNGRWTDVVLAWLLAVTLLPGCGAPGYYPCQDGSLPLELTADVATGTPVFGWSTGLASSIYVRESGPQGRLVWHIQCSGDNGEASETFEQVACIEPLSYGDEPDSPYLDTINLKEPEPLESGVTYHITVSSYTESDDDSCGNSYSGELDFEMP